MQNNVSMTDLFPSCISVLNELLYPIHYKELAERAIKKLGYISINKQMLAKAAEDVREKLLLPNKRGTFYCPTVNYVGGLMSWFPSTQTTLNFDKIIIPGNATASVDGGFEAVMRLPYMKNKVSNSVARKQACVKGLILEKHVTSWFQSKYPEIYCKPPNFNSWKTPCDHDFVLTPPNVQPLKIDVMGKNAQGNYSPPRYKPLTCIHLLCDIDGGDVHWDGCIRGENLRDTVFIHQAFSPISFLVWINCLTKGIDYRTISNYLDNQNQFDQVRSQRIARCAV